MEIIVGKTAGFCFGVLNAVDKTKEALKKYKNVSCLGELVHNKNVTEKLKDNGLEFIESIKEAKENVIIRAHGEKKNTYEEAKKLKLNIIDLTCPKVLKIHDIAEEYVRKGYYIFYIGQKEHPETIGTISYCGKNSSVIEEKNEVQKSLKDFFASNIKKLLIICQTTYSMEKFNDIVNSLKENIKDEIKLEVKNTICNATKLRQEETLEIAKKVDLLIIIGGKHSSNTNKLYQIAKQYGNKSILIETKEELQADNVKNYKRIGIMAGASTPKENMDEVIEFLKNI